MGSSLPAWFRDGLFAIAYAIAFYALFQTAHLFWYLPAGLRFAALLLSPIRRWPWLLAAEVLVFVGMRYEPLLTPHGIIAIVSNPLLAASGPALLRRTGWSMRATSPVRMAWLLAAIALAAIGAMLGNLLYPFGEAARLSPARLLLQFVLGDYVGMLALVPPAWMALRARPDAPMLQRWKIDVPCVLLPILLLYAALTSHSSEPQVFFLSALLCFVPTIHFAVRSGWRGAALALCATSIAVACGGTLIGDTERIVDAQGLLAIAGSVTLLLGTTLDALRASQRAIEVSNRELLASSQRQARLAEELRDAARRNLELSERTRRWITSELHDEIGQNLAALQARVRLLERKAGTDGRTLADEIATSLSRMRRAVSGLMASLRPAGLDDFGLAHALSEGTIRSLLDASGIAFDIRVDDAEGQLDRLDDGTQTALYRIAQEAATNAARHAGATHLSLRLRARREGVLLAIHDDGRGFDVVDRADGIGLQGMRDRVLALGGRMRLRSDARGTRLWVRVTQVGSEAARDR